MEKTLAETASEIGVSSRGSQLINKIFSAIDSLNVDFVNSVYNALVMENRELIALIIALYVGIYGYLVMFGKISPGPTVSEFVWHIGRVFFIMAFGFSFSFFYETMYVFFIYGPDTLISSILNALDTQYYNSQDINHAASIFYDKGTLLGEAIMSMSEMGILSVYFVWGGAVWLITMIITSLTVGLIIVPKILSGILMALAPIFFTFLLFNPTRGLFEGWIRMLFGCFLVPIILYSLLTLTLFALKPSMEVIERDALGGVIDSGHLGAFFLIATILIFLFKKVDSIAMNIAGGYMSTQYQFANGQAKNMYSAGKGAYKKWRNRN